MLRVVQRYHFLKSKSEKVGSDKERLNMTSLKFRVVLCDIMSDPTLSDFDFKKWLGSELPLKIINIGIFREGTVWLNRKNRIV